MPGVASFILGGSYYCFSKIVRVTGGAIFFRLYSILKILVEIGKLFIYSRWAKDE